MPSSSKPIKEIVTILFILTTLAVLKMIKKEISIRQQEELIGQVSTANQRRKIKIQKEKLITSRQNLHEKTIPKSNFKICNSVHKTHQYVFTKESNYTKRKPFAFLKTHKCGSSLLKHIFAKYSSMNEDVTPAGTYISVYAGGYPGKINRNFVNLEHFPERSILDHMRWDMNELNHIYKGREFFKIGLVRNPLSQWVSSYHYFYVGGVHRRNKTLACFGSPYDALTNYTRKIQFKDISEYFKLLKNKEDFIGQPWGFRAVNQMSFDFGLEWREEISKDTISKSLDDFDFIIILERLTESLILLKNLMCMSFESIVYNDIIGCHNCRGNVNYKVHDQPLKYARPNQTKYKLFEPEQKFLEDNYLFNDLKLYEVAVSKFNDRVAEFGLENMKRQVREYEKVEQELQESSKQSKKRKRRSESQRVISAVPIKSNHKGDMVGLKNYMVENYAYCPVYDVIFKNF